MSDTQITMSSPSSRAATPSTITIKRNFDDDHAPTVSSPLNPDAAARPRPAKAREQREKKDSLKKRESTGFTSQTPEPANKKRKVEDGVFGLTSPIRYNHELPKQIYQYGVRDLPLASLDTPVYAPNGVELKKSHDHAVNTRVYRYTACAADPNFSHMHYYRPSESKPYGPRMSLEDSDKCFQFSDSLTVFSNEKGWRTGRANVCAREGHFYYEVKILRGVSTAEADSPNSEPPRSGKPLSASSGPLPHIRVGFARREAPLDSPVGFDGYSYGVTDIRLDPMHKSRPTRYLDDGTEQKPGAKKSSKLKSSKDAASSKKNNIGTGGGGAADNSTNFSADTSAGPGDVIGLEIMLPSLSLHRKIVEGNYNPAVDVGSGLDVPFPPLAANSTHNSTPTTPNIPMYDPEDSSPNIVRDRFPVSYKNNMYFESYDYSRSKAMESYGDRGPFTRETPSPNHSDATVRNLPHSWIKVYKNGKRIGTAFRNLMAFLPPASLPPVGLKEARQGLDDGMCGYFPAVSAFAGGVGEVNFGDVSKEGGGFWFPPEGLGFSSGGAGAGGLVGGSTGGASMDELNGGNTTVHEPISAPENGVKTEDEASMPLPGSLPSEQPSIQQLNPPTSHSHSHSHSYEKEQADVEMKTEDDLLTTQGPNANKTNGTQTAQLHTIPPSKTSHIKAMAERYIEQIAEDVWYDVVDEVDFWVQDGMV